ncbi:MAG TPA: cell wall-active antibiotics response protein LiaF [Paenibacillus sp.]|jgi:lia operon protein LiaF
MDKRKRLLATGLIALGVMMIFGKGLSFFTIVALFLLGYGIYKVRQGEDVKTGYILLAVGVGLILLNNFMLVVAILMISLGFYYAKVRKVQPHGSYTQRQNITSSVHWNRDPWVLQNTSMWHILGELDIDLSLAIMEGPHHVLMFQGIVGDIDMSLFEGYGIEIEAFVLFGQIELGQERRTGILNRVNWRSPNYDTCEQKVKIMISYVVGDIDIRLS